MRVKISLMLIGVLIGFGLLINFYVIKKLEADSQAKLEQTLIHSYKVYTKAQRANREARLDDVRAFAAEPDILGAMKLPGNEAKEAEDRHYALFMKMEYISQLKFPNADLFLVLDATGMELARTRVAVWKTNRFGDNKAVKEALSGKPVEDIWQIDGKLMIVDLVPMLDAGTTLGVMVMGNLLTDDEIVKQEKELVLGQYAFFTQNHILISSLPSDKQIALSDFVEKNRTKIASVLISKNDYFEEKIVLEDETFVAILSPMPAVSEHGLVGYILLASQDQWIKEFSPARNFLLICTLAALLLAIALAFVIIQKAYDAIDFILEGAHQIIVGNKDYEFSSADSYLNQIGQTLNLMIAILLGKFIPEDEEEANRMAMKGSLDTASNRPAPERVLIQNMDGGGDPADLARASLGEESYFDQLFAEFMAAKKQAGEDTELITKDQLILKLKKTEEKLIAKHGCKGVRFSVKLEGGKVSLKPFPIWDK